MVHRSGGHDCILGGGHTQPWVWKTALPVADIAEILHKFGSVCQDPCYPSMSSAGVKKKKAMVMHGLQETPWGWPASL